MRCRSIVTTVSMLAALAGARALGAQLQSIEKPVRFQVTGGAMFPVFSYADYTSGTGWKAGTALIFRRGDYYHIRLEGEYNTVGSELNSGTFETYGAGLGGGRVVSRGKVRQEGYFVAGGYEWKGQLCTGIGGGNCRDYSEWQFGTKIGANAIFGTGKAKFVLDFHWLYTWSEPYVNLLAITGGLRF
jgi:hypothetical protein